MVFYGSVSRRTLIRAARYTTMMCVSFAPNVAATPIGQRLKKGETKDMKLPVVVPFWVDELNVEAEIELSDPSRRILAGIKLTTTWVLPDGKERGVVHHITEQDLTG